MMWRLQGKLLVKLICCTLNKPTNLDSDPLTYFSQAGRVGWSLEVINRILRRRIP